MLNAFSLFHLNSVHILIIYTVFEELFFTLHSMVCYGCTLMAERQTPHTGVFCVPFTFQCLRNVDKTLARPKSTALSVQPECPLEFFVRQGGACGIHGSKCVQAFRRGLSVHCGCRGWFCTIKYAT